MILLSALVFTIAIIGYFVFFTTVFKKEICDFPLAFISFSVVLVCLFGFVGLLQLGLIVLLTGGFFLLIFTIKETGKNGLKEALVKLMDPSVLFVVVGLIWVKIITRDAGVSHPDDFSHWFRICKVMFCDNSLPVSPDIKYLTYPPGTAVWVYIINRLFGFGVSNCFTAQCAINLCAYSVMFRVVIKVQSKLKKVLLYLCIAASFVLLSSVTISTFSLAVDGTLGLVFLSCVIYAFEAYAGDRVDKGILISFLSLLVLIKVSGLLFALMIIMIVVIKRKRFTDILVGVLPVLILVICRLRNSIVYGDLTAGNQAVSFSRYQELFNQKSTDLITYVIYNSCKTSFSILGGYYQVTLVWIAILGMLVLCLFDKNGKTKSLFMFSLVSYFVYVFFLTLTYIFSMNELEAIYLGCFYRYIGTIAIMIFGLFSYSLIKKMQGLSVNRFVIVSLVFISLVVCGGHIMFDYDYLFGGQNYIPYEDWTDKPWIALSETVAENTEYTEESYLVVWDERLWEGYSYIDFHILDLEETFFRSRNVGFIIAEDTNRVNVENESYDHVIVVTV